MSWSRVGDGQVPGASEAWGRGQSRARLSVVPGRALLRLPHASSVPIRSHSALTMSKLGVVAGSKSKVRMGLATVPATRAGASNCHVILDTCAYRLSW